jgi:hypothetical protein
VLFDRLAFYVHVNFRYGCIFALIFYAITYGGALGPMAFSLNSELVSQQFRLVRNFGSFLKPKSNTTLDVQFKQ